MTTPARPKPACAKAIEAHAADGRDELGRGLEIVIRIAPDGRVYLHDITPDLLPLLRELNPHDQSVRQRIQAARAFAPETSA